MNEERELELLKELLHLREWTKHLEKENEKLKTANNRAIVAQGLLEAQIDELKLSLVERRIDR